MPRPGELSYYETIGEEGRRHAINKPFSDPARGTMLMEVGAILSLLPTPPARVLDAGCGTGWLTWFLQKSGYQTIGLDVSPHAIQLAEEHPLFADCEPPRFLAADVENFTLEEPIDAAVFFGSLHHSVDEAAALRCVFQALKPGGICIADETHKGHAAAAREVSERYDVTEKDMHPAHIIAVARSVGFTAARIYPRADGWGNASYRGGALKATFYSLAWRLFYRQTRGIVVLQRP